MNMNLTISGYPHLIKNKYYHLYCKIINNRILNPYNDEYGGENHHILPKSLNGDNNRDNLIYLSSREHYICHYLLTKFITNESYYKMLCAFQYMNMKSKSTQYRYSNSKLYESLKIELQKETSKFQKKLWTDPEYKKLMKIKAKISWVNGSRDKQLEYMKKNSPFKIKEIHEKTMISRKKNKTNVFETNNPMKDPVKAKEIASSRSGSNHYLSKNRKYYYRVIGDEWIEIDNINCKLDESLKLLGLNGTFYKMLKDPTYSPSRGKMKNIEVKRIIL